MGCEVLGISGNPVPNSNTDRLILHVLQASGLNYEFVKLSQLNVGPCRACKGCEIDNICKVHDDFPELAKKLYEAKGLVLGGYTPYAQEAFRWQEVVNAQGAIGQGPSFETAQTRRTAPNEGMLDASTKAFLERLWSMRHLSSLNEQKYVVTIISGLSKQATDLAHKSIAKELFMEKMEHVSQLDISGYENPCFAVEDQPVWEKAAQSGKLLAQFITEEIECWLDYV